jgi:hypothetical protein
VRKVSTIYLARQSVKNTDANRTRNETNGIAYDVKVEKNGVSCAPSRAFLVSWKSLLQGACGAILIDVVAQR